jgi:hypothetical protein
VSICAALSVSVLTLSMSSVFAIPFSFLFSLYPYFLTRFRIGIPECIAVPCFRFLVRREIKVYLRLPTCVIWSSVIVFDFLSAIERLHFSLFRPCWCLRIGRRCLPGFNIRCLLS